jgi:hypothetical protein
LYFRCSIRFPSTSIRLFFQSLIDDHDILDRVDLPSPPSAVAADTKINLKPLCINIPQPSMAAGTAAAAVAVQQQVAAAAVAAAAAESVHASPPNSPTGTLR